MARRQDEICRARRRNYETMPHEIAKKRQAKIRNASREMTKNEREKTKKRHAK